MPEGLHHKLKVEALFSFRVFVKVAMLYYMLQY